MAASLKDLENEITLNKEALVLGDKVKAIYSTLVNEKSASSDLPMTQLIVERMGHISELQELNQNHFTRLRPMILNSYQQVGGIVSTTDRMLEDIANIKKLVAEDGAILDGLTDPIKNRIKNFYTKLSIDGAEVLAKDFAIKKVRNSITDKKDKIFDYAVELTKTDPNTQLLQQLQELISSSQSFINQVNNEEERLVNKIDFLNEEIESLNQQKLRLEFKEEKKALQQTDDNASPPVVNDDLIPYQEKVDKMKEAQAVALDDLETVNTKLVALEHKLALLKSYVLITNETNDQATVWRINLTNIQTDIADMNAALALAKVGQNDAEDVYFKKVSSVNLKKLAKDLIALNDGTKELADQLKLTKSDHVLLSDLNGVASKHEAQKILQEGLISLDEELSLHLKGLKTTLRKLALDNDSMLKVLDEEYTASKFNSLDADITELKLDEAETKAEEDIDKEVDERTEKEQKLSEAKKNLEAAKRAFDTAKIFLV